MGLGLGSVSNFEKSSRLSSSSRNPFVKKYAHKKVSVYQWRPQHTKTSIADMFTQIGRQTKCKENQIWCQKLHATCICRFSSHCKAHYPSLCFARNLMILLKLFTNTSESGTRQNSDLLCTCLLFVLEVYAIWTYDLPIIEGHMTRQWTTHNQQLVPATPSCQVVQA